MIPSPRIPWSPVLDNLQVTRHLDGQYGNTFLKDRKLPAISGIAPGVMAQTGMETAEILKGIIHETHPDLIIAIDALAARSVRRLGTQSSLRIRESIRDPGLEITATA